MTKIDVPEGRALNPAEQELANSLSFKLSAIDWKNTLSYLEDSIFVANAQVELEPEVFKQGYEAAGWGYDKVQKYLRVGRNPDLNTEAFRQVLPLIRSFWILNFLAGLSKDKLQDFIAEYTSRPRLIDRNELFAFAGRSPPKSDTLLDYTIDREKIPNLTPEVKKRIFAKIEELKRLADDHELPTKLKAHQKVIDLLKPDKAELANKQGAESQAPSDDAATDEEVSYVGQAEMVEDAESHTPSDNENDLEVDGGEDDSGSQAPSDDSSSHEANPDVDTADCVKDSHNESEALSSTAIDEKGCSEQ